MERDWNDFKSIHSNISGAREAFENACETLFRQIYNTKSVSQVKVKVGDGGIDIFVGELGIEPITVIQCKFFLDNFDESQKSQIRDSFKAASYSDKYELKDWILCIPRVIDIDEHSWWFKWKNKQINSKGKDTNFISIKNGNELIDLFKQQNLYNQVFQIDQARKIDEIHSAIVPQKNKELIVVKPNVILFNNYSEKCEQFYLERNLDKDFKNFIQVSNLWVFGKSGFGKTALVSRNLIKNNIEYCYCDLSPITIESSESVLKEVLLQIEDKFNLESGLEELNLIKKISQSLKKLCYKKIIIVIDELSVKDDAILKNIANDLISLVTYFNNSNCQDNLKFIVSTISNPKRIIENKSKASEYFQYIDCDDWTNDIEKLFNILCFSLNLKITDDKNYIIESSSNSPRILKSIFRKIIAIDDLNTVKINNAIKVCLSEL
jgi:Cdc6-like AAA superfamily ATPase